MNSTKATILPLFTVHDDPKDAVVASHKLLVRAGFIKRQASGFYIFLPFALKIRQTIEQIIREELTKAGGVEVELPVLTTAELWESSGRWDAMGKEMMRMKDRHDNQFVLAPTHEEAMTWLAKHFLQSYKQLPLNLFQIGNKYRDEIRPRYGLIRCREFVMKDAYSFHLDEESLDETYQTMSIAYKNIFKRCGLETIAVEADTGAMGGSASEEYMVASEIGEETLLLCIDEECNFRSNQEKTEFVPVNAYNENKNGNKATKVPTPNKKTIEEVSEFLKAETQSFIKTVIYENKENIVAAFLPGDREINEVKLTNISGFSDLEMASEDSIEKLTGAEPGYAGPSGLKYSHGEEVETGASVKTVHLFFDRNIKNRGGLTSGANETGMHMVDLEEGRDFQIDENCLADLVLARAGDGVPGFSGKVLTETKGIEVGHIFKLGKKYTNAFDVSVLDQNGKPLKPTMGTYGIGVGRTIATIVEQNHDDKGIIWPETVAPFYYHLIGIFKNTEQKEQINKLYDQMVEAGASVYYDDRKESPGVKFNDADIIGFPWQIIAGKTFIAEAKIELKNRRTGERTIVDVDEFIKNTMKRN
ncbi:MAG: proline--tRNA ligase [Leptospirales bacterium]